MEYLLDSANTVSIKKAIELYNIQGITTNPTLISRESDVYKKLLLELKDVLQGRDFHIQVTEITFDGIIKEAKLIKELIGDSAYIKIPVTDDGYKAIKYLSSKGYLVTATAICNVAQAVMAALCGAKYLAVYINRITKNGGDGPEVIRGIKKIFNDQKISSKILGASFKNRNQITVSILNGCDAVTINPEMFSKMLHSETTSKSVTKFTEDFEGVYGKDTTGRNLLEKK